MLLLSLFLFRIPSLFLLRLLEIRLSFSLLVILSLIVSPSNTSRSPCLLFCNLLSVLPFIDLPSFDILCLLLSLGNPSLLLSLGILSPFLFVGILSLFLSDFKISPSISVRSVS